MRPRADQDLSVQLARLPGWSGAQLDGPISVRDNSRVYRARQPGASGLTAALKVCLSGGGGAADPVEARQQFEALTRVHVAFDVAPDGLAVPAPLFLIPELAAYGMSWVDGESLTDWLRRCRDPLALVDAHRRVGQWLGAFHRLGPLRTGSANLDSKLTHLAHMRLHPLPHPTFAKALDALDSSAAQMSRMALQISWLHGDCKTDNFMLSTRLSVAIDFGLKFENAVEHDLAQFLNGHDLLMLDLRWRRVLPIAGTLQQGFLRGYADAGPSVNDGFLQWMRLCSALSAWQSTVVERHAPWPQRWIMGRLLGTLVARLMRQQWIS